jgi:hypothetical protein
MSIEGDAAPGMRGLVRPLVSGGVVPVVWLSILLAVALAAGWPERAIALRIWLVGAGIVALNVLVILVGRRPIEPRSDAFDRAARPRPPAEDALPTSFTDTARLVELVSGTGGDLHFRVRPVLREITAHRFLTTHGLVLDDPADAAALAERCGPVLWDVVRPDRPEPPDRRRTELGPAAAVEIVDRLEAI